MMSAGGLSNKDRLRCLLVIQPSVSHYREPLITKLFAQASVRYDLAGKLYNPDANRRNMVATASAGSLAKIHPLRTLKLSRFYWEAGLLRLIVRGDYDVVVIEGRIYTISSWAAALVAKVRGSKVLFWGHGWLRQDNHANRLLRSFFYRLADGLLLYGNRAVELGEQAGFRRNVLHPIYNSIYSSATLEQALQRSPSRGAVRRDLGIALDALVLISISRLTKRHALDRLLTSIAGLSLEEQKKVCVLIAGDGAERTRLERLAGATSADVRFLGPIYDTQQIAALYAGSDYCVIPGWAGLNVIQAMGFGVPVITHNDFNNQPPEVEAVRHDETGILYDNSNPDALRRIIQTLIVSSDGYRRRLATNAQHLVAVHYTADKQADAITSVVIREGQRTVGSRRRDESSEVI